MLASPNMEAKSQLLSLKRPLKYGNHLKIPYFTYTSFFFLIHQVIKFFYFTPIFS